MLTAADVMTTDVISVSPATSVTEIANILYTGKISGVPVVDADRRVLGLVSEGDLMGHAAAIGEQPEEKRRSWWLSFFADEARSARSYAKTHGHTAADVMTSPVITVDESASVAKVAKLLQQNRIKRVPVVRDGKLVGIVSRSNLLHALAMRDSVKPASLDDRTIRERLLALLEGQPWANLPMKNIVVQDGVVHLWGFVWSDHERRAMRVAAEDVPGVKCVEDHLEQYKVEQWEPL